MNTKNQWDILTSFEIYFFRFNQINTGCSSCCLRQKLIIQIYITNSKIYIIIIVAPNQVNEKLHSFNFCTYSKVVSLNAIRFDYRLIVILHPGARRSKNTVLLSYLGFPLGLQVSRYITRKQPAILTQTPAAVLEILRQVTEGVAGPHHNSRKPLCLVRA